MACRVLYLLLEESDRELKSRALIAAAALQRGFEVVLIPQWTAWQNWSRLAPGIVLFKGNNAAQATWMSDAKKQGHLVASIEEELLGVVGPSQVRRCYVPEAGEHCDIMLANGRSQADLLKAWFAGKSVAVHVVGNPRMDLLTDKFSRNIHGAAENVRERYGDFVLLNTNFSSINPRDSDALGCFDTCVDVGLLNRSNVKDLEDFFTWCAWERTNLQAVGQFVRDASERSPWPVIVRPHPTENLTLWHQALDSMKNIHVVREGDHLAWTAAARVLVHPGCTTGGEALMLGTPAVSLVVDDNPWHELYLSNFVNPRAGSAADALDLVVDLAGGGDLLKQTREVCLEQLKHHVETGPNFLACVAIADCLAASDSPRIDEAHVRGMEMIRPVTSTEGKIDAETFAPGPVAALIDSYRGILGHAGAVEIFEPVSSVLHCKRADPKRTAR